eukprot:CAMPEP_0196576136 /NCGR_PEP_ID=MMETSP1081-20130531/5478_1 /TAXON_ID=36882 /ORGANISM="Pyramimonas amylifera, Strain CCMP720" /LENGTH=888 /DNA_ID=CAMNT_0041894667 /DNA_START=359 /DNA_END=3025 /DNA_ORIENTATION=+
MTIFRIILQEMLAYDSVRVIYKHDQSTYFDRAVDAACFAIDLEKWNWSPSLQDEENLIVEFMGSVGRQSLFVPKDFSIAASYYKILLEGFSYECPQATQAGIDTVTAYSLYPTVGSTNLSDVYDSPDNYPCNDHTPGKLNWNDSKCTNGSYVPPQCVNGSSCYELYLAEPDWNTGWFEAVIKNLNLKFTAVYLGWKELMNTLEQFHAEGRGLVYYWWEPHPLHLKFPSQTFILPEHSEACSETYTADPLHSGVNCAPVAAPLLKIFPRSLKTKEPDLYHLWNSFKVNATVQMQMMTLEGPVMGGPGNLTVEQAACEWLRHTSVDWQSWLRIESATFTASKRDNTTMFKSTVILYVLLGAFLIIMFLVVLGLWRRNTWLVKKLNSTADIQEGFGRPMLDLESPLNKAISTLDDIIEGTRSVGKKELKKLKNLLTTAGNEPRLGQLLENSNDYYAQDAIKFILNLSGQNTSQRSFMIKLPNSQGSSSEICHVDQNRSSQVWSFDDALPTDLPTTPFTLENLQEVNKVGALGESLMFDTIQLSSQFCGKALVVTAMFFLHTKLGLVERLGLDEVKLVAFLEAIELGYSRVNPYHNNTHAADVTQRFATLLTKSELIGDVFGEMEVLAGVLAAVIHDVHHPGTTNNYQVQLTSSVARQFNDQHVLENQSLCLGLELLEPGKDTDFMEKSLSRSQKHTLRSNIIALVLATDMQEHFNILSAFKAKIMSRAKSSKDFRESTGSGGTSLRDFRSHQLQSCTSEERLLIMKMALKCADIGHITLPVQAHLQWVQSLQVEFYKQGDLERKQNMPISFLCDQQKPRNGPAYGENQLGFIDVICEPLYGAWTKVFTPCQELMNALKTNRRYWDVNSRARDTVSSIDPSDIIIVSNPVIT